VNKSNLPTIAPGLYSLIFLIYSSTLFSKLLYLITFFFSYSHIVVSSFKDSVSHINHPRVYIKKYNYCQRDHGYSFFFQTLPFVFPLSFKINNTFLSRERVKLVCLFLLLRFNLLWSCGCFWGWLEFCFKLT
jgi:hypothetical protein